MSDTEATQLKPGRKNVGKIPDGGGEGTKRGVLPRSSPYEAISIMRLITLSTRAPIVWEQDIPQPVER